MTGLDRLDTPGEAATTSASLTAVILEEEARRRDAQDAETTTAVLADDLLVGARAERLSLRQALRSGGSRLLFVLCLITLVDEFDRVAMPILAPDIQNSLGVSDAVIGAIGGASGVLFVLGAVPLAHLADRMRRTTIAGAATTFTALFVFLTGLAPNAFVLFCTRMGSGLGQSHVLPVHSALLSDGYPIGARSRVFGIHALASPVGHVVGTLVVAGVAAMTTDQDGWRVVFLVLAVPVLVSGLLAFGAREPTRGANEQLTILGETLEETSGRPPIALGQAFARLKQIRTFSTLLMGVGALGFALFSVPLFVNIHLEDDFGLSSTQRALVDAITFLPALISVPLMAMRNERVFRESPPRSLTLVAGLIAAFGAFVVAATWMPNVWSYTLVFAIAVMLSRAAFALIGPIVASVVPYRLRSQGFAMVGIYIFLFGAFFGAVLTGWISDSWGEQVALTIVVLPSTLLGAALIARGATTVRGDITLTIDEIIEEKEDHRRRASTEKPPALQVHGLDFSYGPVQILFDVDLEVAPGETLALLGTNGAGKSTLLRAISGLGVPSRGVVRLHGETITFTEAEHRVKMGIVQVAGGRATLDPLTVRENLRLGAYLVPRDEVHDRIARAIEPFPVLAERLDDPAGSLSGGQRQQLALAKALVLDPQVLLIDELSLGLAPVVVQDLLAHLEGLRRQGITMVIVEQSVNVALAIADRAVFMEKGRVRFSGPARDLLERDDLLRAVFLGSEGG
jgi:ABC-type branched-subunit amino acid transport system ATPase component/sugar phosphate permease